jgi:hypothetical protein
MDRFAKLQRPRPAPPAVWMKKTIVRILTSGGKVGIYTLSRSGEVGSFLILLTLRRKE